MERMHAVGIPSLALLCAAFTVALAGAGMTPLVARQSAGSGVAAQSAAVDDDSWISVDTFSTASASGLAAEPGATAQTPAAVVNGAGLGGTVAVRCVVKPAAPPGPSPTTSTIPIYRFYSPKSGTHFYTPSAEERDMVMARWSDVWSYEGIAYTVNPAKNRQPLYRFYNRANGSHFYTASLDEANTVITRWSNVFQYDGPTYAVTPEPESGKTPVYRFYNVKNGSHFYTASVEELNLVLTRWASIYTLEGEAFRLGQ